MTFNEKYEKIKDLSSEELLKIEKTMLDYIDVREPLNSSVKNFLKLPSKRIRSVLAVLYLKSLEEELSEEQYNILSCVELVHSASLIHDDIIDECEIRRGQKTLSAKFGNKLGVISGDYLLSLVMEKISQINSMEVLDSFSSTLKQMCLGEINQNFDLYKIGTIEKYIEKSKNKTGYLFQTALEAPLLLCKKAYDIEKAKNFGLNFGIAFQIRDDILNLTTYDELKPSKNDIKEGIYNAAVIYAGSIENYMAGIEKAKTLLNNYIEQAKNLLVKEDNIYNSALFELLELLKHE